jgi:tetratricopeptide (TPR) repeat protein
VRKSDIEPSSKRSRALSWLIANSRSYFFVKAGVWKLPDICARCADKETSRKPSCERCCAPRFRLLLMRSNEREPIGSLGIARYQISQAQWDESIATLVESISPSPAESSLLGRIYAQRANVEGLAKWVSQWSRSRNQNADAWFALGTEKAISGHHESAVRCFCEVVIREPTDVEAYSSMSRSLEILRAHAEAGEAAKRSELIRRTQLIGSEMAESDARDLNKISELVGLLDQLHRRDESLAWRAIQLAYGQSDLTAEQTRQRMTEINRSRLELLKTDTLDASESFIVCGVDLRSLRSKDDAVSKSEDAN